MVTPSQLQIDGLDHQDLIELSNKAKQLGMTPERYVRELVQMDLSLDREARKTTIAELVGPGREVDEQELDRLVEEARNAHHQKSTLKG